MIAAANHEQHRTGHGRAGKPVAALNRAHSPAARHKAQDTRRAYTLLLPRRVGLDDLPVNSPALRGRHFSRGWFGHPDDITNFRTRTYAGLTAEQVAALLEFQSGHHVLADISDGSEHVERLSTALADGNNHSEAPTHAAGSITQGLGNV